MANGQWPGTPTPLANVANGQRPMGHGLRSVAGDPMGRGMQWGMWLFKMFAGSAWWIMANDQWPRAPTPMANGQWPMANGQWAPFMGAGPGPFFKNWAAVALRLGGGLASKGAGSRPLGPARLFF